VHCCKKAAIRKMRTYIHAKVLTELGPEILPQKHVAVGVVECFVAGVLVG
jgi:hypothetical protein